MARDVVGREGEAVPNLREVHQDAVLSNIAESYSFEGFIADIILPSVPVTKESDIFYRFYKEELLPTEDVIGDNDEAGELEWFTTTGTYVCVGRALKSFVPSRVIRNADAPIRPLVRTTEKLSRNLDLNKEIRVAALLAATVDTTGQAYDINSSSTKWNTHATADPLGDLEHMAEQFELACGAPPTHFVLPRKVKTHLVQCVAYKEEVKYTHGDRLENYGVLPPKLAGMIPLIAGQVKNTADEGAAESLGYVWGNDVYLIRVNPRPDLMDASWGYQLTLSPKGVRRWNIPERGHKGGTMVQVEFVSAEQVVNQYYVYEGTAAYA